MRRGDGAGERITLIRLSALGDVVMLLPVLRALTDRYPQLHITLVSPPFVAALAGQFPQVHFVGAALRGRHRGLGGMWRLAGDLLKAGAPGVVADMHSVLRTWLLTFFLCLRRWPHGLRCARIDKGRAGKRELTRAENKRMVQQAHSVERYAEVLRRLGYPVEVPCQLGGFAVGAHAVSVPPLGEGESLWVGMAPFAKHGGKIYPLERSYAVAQMLRSRGCQLFLFGSRGAEADVLSRWAQELGGGVVVPQLGLDLSGELMLMHQLDAMLSMDSANMHLASWAGVEVVSVWGATHPLAGFLGWGQRPDTVVQREDLPCRPCSVFGNRPCVRGDFACMDIAPSVVAGRVMMVARRKGRISEEVR